MELITKAPKGTVDIIPGESEKWSLVEAVMTDEAELNGFSEIRTPVFEHTELFLRSVGDTTDVVEKQMYTFEDKGGRSITLRPEGTAGTVRAMLENHPGVHSETVQVRLSEFADSSIDIAVQFYTKTTDIVEYRAVKEDVNLRIMDIMAGEGASFAFPSRSIYIENAPSLPDGKGGLQ